MSNEIIISDRPDFLPAPTGSGSTMSEFMGGLGGGSGLDMPVLSVRGKVFRLRRDGQEASLKTSVLDVILVGARSNTSRRFYAGKYQSGEVKAPTCSSAHGIVPDSNVTEPQSDACATCPHNQWERTSTGMRKACDDYKRVLVFLPERNIYTPVTLDVSATSLRKKKGETGPELQMREYVQALARNQFEPHQVVTTLGFTDDEYPRLQFSFRRVVTQEEYANITQTRESDEFHQALDHTEAEGPIVQTPEAAPKPEAKAKPAPKPAPTPKAAPKPAPKPEPVPEPEAEEELPAAAEAEPEVEAQAAPVEEETDDGDDSLDDILSMLK